jgi:hypothetical protein
LLPDVLALSVLRYFSDRAAVFEANTIIAARKEESELDADFPPKP